MKYMIKIMANMRNKFFYILFCYQVYVRILCWTFLFTFFIVFFAQEFLIIFPLFDMLKNIYRVFAVPLFQDNYSYVIQGSKPNQLVLVDPANPTVVMEFLKKNFVNFQVSNIFYTHKHWDHAGGNEELSKAINNEKLKIYIGENDKSHVPAANVFLKGGEDLEIGDQTVKTYFVPCHTRGHIVYHFLPRKNQKSLEQIGVENMHTIQGKKVRVFETEQCAFTGDTLFSGGIGRFFQGNAQQMAKNIQLLTSKIGDSVSIFNGHQYTFSNIKWAVEVQKQNHQLKQYYEYLLKEISDKGGEQNICTLPTTFKKQKQINLFVRSVTGTYLHDKITKDSVKLMGMLRQMKNKNLTQFTYINQQNPNI